MRNRSLAAIAVVLAFSIFGCSSSTKLTIESIEDDSLNVHAKPVTYTSFWEAMENVDSNYAKANQLDDEHRPFAEALSRMVAGDIDSAEIQLQTLYHSSQDSLVRKHSKEILSALLLSRSQWQEMSRMLADSGTREQASTDALVKVFSKCPKEEYMFPPHAVTLPITLSMTGSPIVEIEVNGHKQKFWLDTGAGLSVVASDIAEECNILPLGSEKIQVGTATSKNVGAYPTTIAELNIGGILIKNHPAMILNKDDLEFKLLGFIRILKIDGIIGWNAIQNIAMEIDYRNKSVTMNRATNAHNANHNLFWLGYPTVKILSQDGVELNFGLDTGAKTSSIRQNIFRKIGASDVESKTKSIGSAGGVESADVQVLPRLSLIFNHSLLLFEEISTSPSNLATFVKLDGVLGSDVFQDGTLVLDYQNGIVELVMPEK